MDAELLLALSIVTLLLLALLAIWNFLFRRSAAEVDDDERPEDGIRRG
jgi:hypothetical protein